MTLAELEALICTGESEQLEFRRVLFRSGIRQQTLPPCLGGELRRLHIRHPDLDRPHALGPQTLAVLPHLATIGSPAGGLGINSWGGFRFHDGFVWGYMSF